MTLNMYNGSDLAMLRGLRAAALAGVAALLVACGGDSDCNSPPAFEGEQVGECNSDPSGAPRASSLSLTLTVNGVFANSIPNDGRSKITATATATTAGGVAVPDIPVTFSVDNNAVATLLGESATDDKGVVVAEVGIGDNPSNRTVTVTATSGGLSRTASFQVVGASLQATPLPNPIPPSTPGRVDFLLKDVSGAPMIGREIVVTGPDGSTVSGSTGSSGDYTYNYTAPAATGSLNISATAGGATATTTVLVDAGSGTIPPATSLVQSASLAASPSVVAVNSGTTSNRTELRALFVGNNNKAVQNVRVRFDLAGDTNGVGGEVTTGTAVVYSDANGIATAAYVPGSRSSPTDGLTLRACWSESDFPVGACPNQATTTVTVVSDTVSVTIGTDATIELSGQSYVKRYVVQVVDASGLAKAGVQITPSIDLQQYFKGEWRVVGDKWVKNPHMLPADNVTCDNEDLNRNSVLQVYSNGAIEDANGTGSLEPRKADVAISFDGSSTTNGNGQVVLKIIYAQSVASWLKFNIQVAAGGVSGTEGRTNYVGVLPVLADAVSDPDSEPAFRASPYGTQPSPTVLTTNPLGQSGQLCTNAN